MHNEPSNDRHNDDGDLNVGVSVLPNAALATPKGVALAAEGNRQDNTSELDHMSGSREMKGQPDQANAAVAGPQGHDDAADSEQPTSMDIDPSDDHHNDDGDLNAVASALAIAASAAPKGAAFAVEVDRRDNSSERDHMDIDASDHQRNDAADLNAVTSDLPNAASAAPSGAAFAAEGNRRDETSDPDHTAEGTNSTGSGSIRIMLTRAEHEQLQQARHNHPQANNDDTFSIRECTSSAPPSINVFTDGGLANPRTPPWAIGTFGIWWPGRSVELHPVNQAEQQMAHWQHDAGGIKLRGMLQAPACSSTRTELAAGIVGLCADGPVHIGSDSKSFIGEPGDMCRPSVMATKSQTG